MFNFFLFHYIFFLQIITNGIYHSIEHRATVNSEKERISIATFYTTKHDGEIGPAKSLINEETLAQFKGIGLKEYLKNMFARKLDGKSFLDALRI
jgi:isopenicillin N synthase-like dioxygenase